MQALFTELVRGLGEAPDRRLFAAAWNRLRGLLRGELKRRGLWDGSPNYLGVYGWRRWQEPGGEKPAHDDALEELTAECYAFIFVARIWSLKAQLKVKPNVEGLVLLNVRHFLFERQREHDPLGFQVFEVVHGAVCEAISHGDLVVLHGDPKVRNETLLGFDPAVDPNRVSDPSEDLVARWNDDLMPALVTARGAELRRVRARLLEHLRTLPRNGVRSFRFKKLIDPLKLDARARWARLLGADGPAQDLERGLHRVLEETYADRQSREHLARCVAASIHALELEPRTKAQLASLWEELCRAAAEDRAGPADGEGVPSQRKLAERLGIRRARLPELFDILRQLVLRPQRILALKGAKPVSSHDR